MEVIKNKLKEMLSDQRYKHCIGTMKEAAKLAKIYGADTKKAEVAGLLHDCAKNIPADEAIELCKKFNIELDNITMQSKGLIHAKLGAILAKHRFNIDDEEILNAIRYHTTGKANMKTLEKIIYIADLTEENRTFNDVDKLRQVSYKSLNQALLMAIDISIDKIIKKQIQLHPDTVEARNYLLIKENWTN